VARTQDQEREMSLKGKVCIITGASRGIGRDVAVALGAEGASVVVAARSESVWDKRLPGTIYSVAEEVAERGGQGFAVKCDVSKDEDLEQLVEKTVEKFGRIDMLMNNAAILIPGNMQTVQPRHLDLIWRVDGRAPLMAIKLALPHLIAAGGGHIINVSSRAAVFPGAGPYNIAPGAPVGGSFYGMIKAGLERLSQGLARELTPHKIAVNVLSPQGGIATPGNRFARNDPENPDLNFEEAVDMGKATVWLMQQDPTQFTGNILYDKEVVAKNGL
jgi:NAD(P)-dependent dehydrogenase (short-subunit alcohol dehydrogenase family)